MMPHFVQDSIPVIERVHFAPPCVRRYDIPEYASNGAIHRLLRSFAAMPANWDGYGAVPPETQTIANAIRTLDLVPAAVLNRTTQDNIGLTPYGTVLFEWERSHFFLMIEIGKDEVAINGRTPNGKVDSKFNVTTEGLPPLLAATQAIAEWYLPNRDSGIYLPR